MAINAGVAIGLFDGYQYFDSLSESWKGITVTVNYPPGQNVDNNLPAEGTLIIEESGNVWTIIAVEVVDKSSGVLRVDLQLYQKQTTAQVGPNLGGTKRGAIIDPVNGFLAPHWNSSIVDIAVGRIANMVTMQNMADVWKGDVDLGGE